MRSLLIVTIAATALTLLLSGVAMAKLGVTKVVITSDSVDGLELPPEELSTFLAALAEQAEVWPAPEVSSAPLATIYLSLEWFSGAGSLFPTVISAWDPGEDVTWPVEYYRVGDTGYLRYPEGTMLSRPAWTKTSAAMDEFLTPYLAASPSPTPLSPRTVLAWIGMPLLLAVTLATLFAWRSTIRRRHRAFLGT